MRLASLPKGSAISRAARERIIEKAGEVDVTASAVVAAVQAYSKINSAGQWVDRSEQVNLNDLFDRMSTEELEAYAQDGTLPRWFETAGADISSTYDSQRLAGPQPGFFTKKPVITSNTSTLANFLRSTHAGAPARECPIRCANEFRAEVNQAVEPRASRAPAQCCRMRYLH
jgi:hypothetical protein